jgi:hypothetical protein
MRRLQNRPCGRGTIAGNLCKQKTYSNHKLPASLGIVKTRGGNGEFDILNEVELAVSARGQQPPW